MAHVTGAGVVRGSVSKVLAVEPEDPSLIPSTHVRKSGTGACSSDHSTGETEKGDSWNSGW